SDVRIDELESAIRTVCEPIANKPIKDISFGQVLMRLFEAAQRFNVEVQPQLLLLQKTLLQIEGLGRQIYPELDLWKTAQPLLRQWTRERYGFKQMLKRMRRDLPDLMDALQQVPQILERAVYHAAHDPRKAPVGAADLER